MVSKISKELAQQIVDTVKGVCGYNINFINRNGYVIASTDPSRIDTFHEIGSKVANSGNSIEVSVSDKYAGTRRGINLPIYYNRECIAVVGISGEPDKVRPFGVLAQRITVLLIREQELNSISSAQTEQRTYILNSFLRQEIKNQAYLDELLVLFKIQTDSEKRILLFRMNSGLPASIITSVEHHTLELYQALGIKLYMRQYPNDLVGVIEDADLKKAKRLLQEFVSQHQDTLRIGIGKATALEELSSSYECAKIAVKAARDRECGFVLFDDLTLDLILTSLSWSRRQEYLKKTVGMLKNEDIDLLRKYYAFNMSLSETSQALFVHKNTIQYQLNRIYEITGLNPRRFQDGVLLYLAVCLCEQN